MSSLTAQKRAVSPLKNEQSRPPLSLYEPSSLNLQKRTAVPPPHSSNKRARSESSHDEKPASPADGGAAAIPVVKQRETEQTPAPAPAPSRSAPSSPSPRSTHSTRTIPIATKESILAGIEPKLAQFIFHTFRRLMDDYPSPGLPLRGLEVLARMMTEAKNPHELAKRLIRSYSRWRARWTTQTFKPQLWRWLTSGDWEVPPFDSAEERRTRVFIRR